MPAAVDVTVSRTQEPRDAKSATHDLVVKSANVTETDGKGGAIAEESWRAEVKS